MKPRATRILILGGTREARELAEALANDSSLAPILSLAGRTANPTLPTIAFRIGGFGGVAGLIAYLQSEAIDLVVDATHPFAEQISANGLAACRATGVPLVHFTRPPWQPVVGDCWMEVEDAVAAAAALGPVKRRVFLTVGRLQLPFFETAPVHHYLIRTIDPPVPRPNLPDHQLLLARGPFSLDDEMQLMTKEKIGVLVTKNSGGDSTYAKIEAARKLAIPVILMRPPIRVDPTRFYALEALLVFIRNFAHQRVLTPRGV